MENRREEKEEKNRWRERERACILQTFYHKNVFKNTLNFKINFIIKLYNIFEKNSCPLISVNFFDHLQIFDHLAFDILIFDILIFDI